MKTTNNTIFITGGSAGIGLAYAKAFLARGNKVIICGRNETELALVKKTCPDIRVIKCDITKADEVARAFEEIKERFKELNILINNAGIQHNYNFYEDNEALKKIDEEIDVNFRAVAKLTKLFLPLLMKQKEAAVINISSPLGIVPKESAPIYCATKAAVHIFSKVLRYQLEKTSVRVFTVFPPLVDTAMTKGRGEKLKISPETMAEEVIKGIEYNHYEMPVKKAKLILFIHRLTPSLAYRIMRKGL
jgi:short-subunit dehydrogenase involved in D-alanine esterification of teichoic acids